MRKVTENTFKAYAKEAVKQLNTLEITATLYFSCMGAEISLYREGSALVGRISISFDGSASAKDWVRNENFDIEPLHDTMKDLFNAVYEAVNSRLDDNGFKTEEVEEQETAKQYFVVNYEKDGIFHANITSAEKKSDVEAKYSEYDAFAVVEANDYIVKEAKIKHMPIIEVEPVKQEGRNKMESVKPLSIKVERAISKMALGDCTLTGVTELSDYCHDIYVTIETGKDRYELKVILKRNIDGVTTIAIVEDGADEATHVFTDKGCKSLDAIAYHTKMLIDGMYAQRMFDMSCEITDPEYFEEHQEDTEEQIEEKEEEVRPLTVTLHPEDGEEEITITYEDAKGFHHAVGQEALEIEKSTDGISIDKDHVYIVIEFLNGSEATFRRSSVVRIAEEGYVLFECDSEPTAKAATTAEEVKLNGEPQPTPEDADKELTYDDFTPEADCTENEANVKNRFYELL